MGGQLLVQLQRPLAQTDHLVMPRRERRSEPWGEPLAARRAQSCPVRDFQYPGSRCRCMTAKTSMRSGLARYTTP